MSLISVEEIHDGREGGDEIVSKERSKITRMRNFRAICSSPYDGPDAVIAAMDPLGTPHPVASNCLLMKRTAKNHAKSKVVFIASQIYSSDPIVGTNPFDDPAEISWSTEQYSRIFQFDAYGLAILNSANDAFASGVKDTDSYWVANVKKNVTSIPDYIIDFRNSVNSSSFVLDNLLIDKYCGWLKAIKIGHLQYRTNTAYRAMEFTIAVKTGLPLNSGQINACFPPSDDSTPWPGPTTTINDDWYRYILDEGYYSRSTNGNANLPNFDTPLQNKNADGTSARVKKLLDGTGHLLTGGPNPPNNGTPFTAVFLAYMLKSMQDFNLLPLS